MRLVENHPHLWISFHAKKGEKKLNSGPKRSDRKQIEYLSFPHHHHAEKADGRALSSLSLPVSLSRPPWPTHKIRTKKKLTPGGPS